MSLISSTTTNPANTPLFPQATSNHASRQLSASHPTPTHLSPQSPSFIAAVQSQRKRLLVPTFRRNSENCSPKPSFMKPATNKFSRSRSGSTSVQSAPDSIAAQSHGATWLSNCTKFEAVEEQFEMEGYQLYAVEKWVVDRTHLITVLVVHTGDSRDKINVTAFAPLNSLSPGDMQAAWENALNIFRKDGARPKETDRGVIMVTSLANFRSDFTIVQIPSGNFPEVVEQLYTNINLLRMGCSGRSALTLQEPGDTTKDRFIAMYYVQDKVRSRELFNATVLELVKFIQSGLVIFGIFDLGQERNGLLCDATVDGIQRWMIEIGEPYVNVEPTERLADPSVISALLSLVLTMRNKLCDIGFGHVVPRDPFLDPLAFINALAVFHNSRHNVSASSNLRFATGPIIEALNAAHDKFRQAESYKVHRVLKSKLDDLTTDLRTTSNDCLVSTYTLGTTQDLNVFVKAVLSGGKDGVASLRYLWSGRPSDIHKSRKEQVYSDGEKEVEIEKDKHDKIDGKFIDDEPEFSGGTHWSGRMQRKLESWTVLGRNKKTSIDLGSKAWSLPQPDSTPASTRASQMPSVIISAEDDEMMSSGQASPIWEQPTAASSAFGFEKLTTAESSVANLTDYERRLTEFNQKRPQLRYPTQNRIVSWSDPMSMRGMTNVVGRPESPDSEGDWGRLPNARLDELGEPSRRQSLVNLRLHRRRTFSDLSSFKAVRVLPLDRMRIDVELCAQMLIMRRREIHLQNVIACLRELTRSLSGANTHLREEYQAHSRKLQPFLERGTVINDIESARLKADAITQETRALQYEFQQFRVGDLWQAANSSRQKMLELREKIYGTGRKLPQGVRGAHGRFNRVQWTLDGRGRLVDWQGMTESDVDEESGLEDVIPPREAEVEEDVVEHPELKPTWLLNFFHNFGTRWGAGAGAGGASKKNDDKSQSSSRSPSPDM